MRRMILLVAMAVAVTLTGSCKRQAHDSGADNASNRKPPMASVERQRGDDACTSYVKALCACAAASPNNADLADRCHMKQAKREALELALGVDDDPQASEDSRLRARVEARRLIAKCIEEASQLPTLGCH